METLADRVLKVSSEVSERGLHVNVRDDRAFETSMYLQRLSLAQYAAVNRYPGRGDAEYLAADGESPVLKAIG